MALWMSSLPIGDPKQDINNNVSTVANTYENVTNVTGKGVLSCITMDCASLASLLKLWVKIQVDGGTALEIDYGKIGLLYSSVYQFQHVSLFIPFKTSLLVQAKNDTDTTQINVTTIYTLS